MITKKTYKEFQTKDYHDDKMVVVTKMITEYKFLGVTIYKKVLFTPMYYGYQYHEGFVECF